ncbi:hypothetical protein [Phenylobacterium sp.]|uniref:hypothetical protein n=1 Tax=Phenylobacterium sp. TaxID=1871053 RepID=UPI0025FB7692|nr:hypothetical protein [Phenylobacterium sp.]
MSDVLASRLEAELATPAPAAVVALAAALADPARDAAILYYGSTLRTGDLAGVLDFYRLTRGPHRSGLHGLVERLLWPEVSYHEVQVGEATLRAKVATLPLATFRRAAEGRTLDTTIWARFVQPAQRVWSGDTASARVAAEACAAAVITAGRYAAKFGPAQGPPHAFWLALFRRTYAAEFRMETSDRADTVLASGEGRYAELLPLAWQAGGVAFEAHEQELRPAKQGLPGWMLPNLLGKPLNVARILKAAFTFEGAARYAAYKIERHTGVDIPVTPFRERHPFLAAPGAWLQLRKHQAEARRARLSSPNS